MSAHIIRSNEATKDTATSITKRIATIKQEEKLVQYLMKTAIGAESRGTARPTSEKTNEMCKSDPRTTFQGERNGSSIEEQRQECGVHAHQCKNR